MIYLDLIINLALLVALTAVSGFLDKRWPHQTMTGRLLQGLLFGAVAVLGMLRPLTLEPGLIIDGQSILLSLCALFFGPWAAGLAGGLSLGCRVWLGGPGVTTGLLVIVSSLAVGLLAHSRYQPAHQPPTPKFLYSFGLLVHVIMLALMLTLPGGNGPQVIMQIGLPVILMFPLTTLLTGKLLADHFTALLTLDTLRNSEEQYRRLVESTQTIPWEFDLQSQRFTFIGQQIERLLGVSPASWETLDDWAAMIHPDDRPLAVDYCLNETREGRDHMFEYRILTPEGKTLWMRDDVSVQTLDGHPYRLSGFIHDITELKQAIEAARHSEATLRQILNATSEGIYGVDQDGVCTFFNASAQRQLGYTEQEMIGLNVHNFLAHTDLNGQPIEEGECRLAAVLTSGEPYISDDGILWQRDDSWINVEYRLHPIQKDQKVVGAVVTFLDITEKKRQIEQRILSGQLASLGELATGVAHEINNPITGMINYAQLLLNKNPEDERERRILSNIIKEGNRIAAIVASLLSFAHKDRSLMKATRVDEIVDESVELLQQQLVKDGVFLDVEIPDNLPRIIGNAQKLEQVLLNLISNARHALNEKYPKTDPNKILRISAEHEREGHRPVVRVVVWDQGTGISKLNQRSVFNRFFTTKPASQGTGLGLSIVHDILKEHSAGIHIETEAGLYTKIVMTFTQLEENAGGRSKNRTVLEAGREVVIASNDSP